jgi:hypothetical protein
MSMNHRPIIHVLAMSLILGLPGCEEVNLALPSESEAAAHYASSSDLTVHVKGNVVELAVEQPIRQVRRGGSLWAKVGPYIYLFSDQTEALLREYPGLSGVRVITRTHDDTEVARAFLHRDSLNELTWRRARNIAGRARVEGTRRPSLLEDLVEWGQDHTEFAYNKEFVR